MKNPCFLSTLTLAVALAPSAAVCGAVVNLGPTADAWVTTGPTNNLSATNYGGAGALGVSRAGAPKGEFQSVMKFQTSPAKSTFDGLFGPGGWQVQTVTLQLTAIGVNHPIFNANNAGSFAISWMQNDGWTEGTGTPNAPTATGINYTTLLNTFINGGADQPLGTFSYNGSNSGTVIYTLGTPAGFVADLLAGNITSLRFSAADSAVSYLFNSRSFVAADSRPLLRITAIAIPEPALMALLAAGGFLGAVRRRARERP